MALIHVAENIMSIANHGCSKTFIASTIDAVKKADSNLRRDMARFSKSAIRGSRAPQ